jgi:aldehyde dehydrogenase (NAD+)
MMNSDWLTDPLQRMRHYYESGATKPYRFRKEQLQHLRRALDKYEEPLHKALYADLKKSPEESWVTETGFVRHEISNALRNLEEWMQPEKTGTNLVNFPSSSFIMREPLGVVFIIAPWNYPFQLLFAPLVGAIAAGNCIVLKPSELAPATAAVMKQLVEEVFPKEYILYAEGEGAEVVPGMMNSFRFDHIFYTGSTATGKLVYQMAAQKLVPVTLELGGKSPCVVENDANIRVAARRIALAKFSNAGQMCAAPDYVLVHSSVKQAFVKELQVAILQFFSDNPATSYNYSKIINPKQFARLVAYLRQAHIVLGGQHNEELLYIAPTIVDKVSTADPIMQEEIFGPILPVIGFDTMPEAKAIISEHPDPLAFYLYTNSSKKQKQWLEQVAAGGACINNCSWHLTNHHLPFGGRGNSGIGAYHGRESFEVFSHRKAIMRTPTWFDPAAKYPPFKGKLKLFKWIIR